MQGERQGTPDRDRLVHMETVRLRIVPGPLGADLRLDDVDQDPLVILDALAQGLDFKWQHDYPPITVLRPFLSAYSWAKQNNSESRRSGVLLDS